MGEGNGNGISEVPGPPPYSTDRPFNKGATPHQPLNRKVILARPEGRN